MLWLMDPFIIVRQRRKNYVSKLLQQNSHLSEVSLILKHFHRYLDFHIKGCASTTSCTVLQKLINMHVTFDLSI